MPVGYSVLAIRSQTTKSDEDGGDERLERAEVERVSCVVRIRRHYTYEIPFRETQSSESAKRVLACAPRLQDGTSSCELRCYSRVVRPDPLTSSIARPASVRIKLLPVPGGSPPASHLQASGLVSIAR